MNSLGIKSIREQDGMDEHGLLRQTSKNEEEERGGTRDGGMRMEG